MKNIEQVMVEVSGILSHQMKLIPEMRPAFIGVNLGSATEEDAQCYIAQLSQRCVRELKHDTWDITPSLAFTFPTARGDRNLYLRVFLS